ncbi:hypothetical protein GCM10011374_38650 [Kocuria dechangensis]|uniref:Uncharacterized protein n=1 Tax=Kocuria dechangensis TaxID=1176249 RepID=A0A917H7M7_9MICC|nr:hypothetical protein [Kocuria dechangensis]GGG70386.1 hypothetical protein GCM10011374_38650 [Kocuria dechangensis]
MSNTTRTVRTGLTADVLESSAPEWVKLRDTAVRLRQEVKRRQADQPAILETNRAVSDALLAADGPAAIQSVLDAARLEQHRREAETHDLAVLASAMDRAEHQLRDLEENSTEAVTEEIRDRVATIASKLYGLRHRPLSAQDAIHLDAVEEWKILQQLAAEWQQLAGAYRELTRHTVSDTEVSILAAAAFTGDPLRVHPHFIGRRRAAAKANVRPQAGSFHEVMHQWAESAPATRFETEEPRGGAVPKGADAIAWIVYLAEQDALVVHDPYEAIKLWNAAEAATDELTPHSSESRAVARVQYAKLTGDDSLTTCDDLRPLIEQGKRRPARGSFFG